METTNETQQVDQNPQSSDQELTDEQLLQMAEGSCTWGANCGK
ncbi:hypothetical protein A176_001349 [Myxococcus hansupus]|uniref:Uncharacterized protein n=1 Tax=Pseudomyxococcus hansupus TaxID=1297742 RepID=A0A0H4X983_9BACT|nr:hypothetical protein [Myxococcus hansupus]AKQ64437.1 hypothetical protein A176_001349 [Myxococcus hansupus]